jgi:hypothetical protein
MIYLWTMPEDYLDCDIGVYNRDLSPDRFLLYDGRELSAQEFSPVPIVEFEVPKNRLLKFDCLPNNSSIPLVNNRVKLILENLAPDEVQFFPAKLYCEDGELEGYYFLNITKTIVGIDHEKSICKKMKTVDAIGGFRCLTYKPVCMDGYQLARDKEYLMHLLISQKIKSIFEKERITGARLIRPEDYYGPKTEITNSYNEKVGFEMDKIVQKGKATGWMQQQYEAETKKMLSEWHQELRTGNIA